MSSHENSMVQQMYGKKIKELTSTELTEYQRYLESLRKLKNKPTKQRTNNIVVTDIERFKKSEDFYIKRIQECYHMEMQYKTERYRIASILTELRKYTKNDTTTDFLTSKSFLRFGKRRNELNRKELTFYTNSLRKEDTLEENGFHIKKLGETRCFKLFGKVLSDLTKEEAKEYYKMNTRIEREMKNKELEKNESQ